MTSLFQVPRCSPGHAVVHSIDALDFMTVRHVGLAVQRLEDITRARRSLQRIFVHSYLIILTSQSTAGALGGGGGGGVAEDEVTVLGSFFFAPNGLLPPINIELIMSNIGLL